MIRRSLRYAEELTDAVKQQLALAYSAKDLLAFGALLVVVARNVSEARHFVRLTRIAPKHDVMVMMVMMVMMMCFTLAVDGPAQGRRRPALAVDVGRSRDRGSDTVIRCFGCC